MTPEFVDKIDKARMHLSKARHMLNLEFFDEAGRLAYIAGFNAAQGYLFELTGKVFKTHKGLQDQFYLTVKDDNRFDKPLKVFLSRTYRLKAIADYEVGPSATVPKEIAADAIETGERFVTLIANLIQTR